MSKAPDSRNKKNSISSLDRRQFIMGGLALAAASMLPNLASGAPTKQPHVIPRRKLGGTL